VRLQLGTAATILEEEQPRLPEFGTGLRARLDVARSVEPPPLVPPRRDVSPKPKPLGAVRRDVSPELMLVSPEPEGVEGVLAELLAHRVREARREPLGALLAEAGLLAEAEVELALRTARSRGKRLGEVLTELGLVAPADVVRMVAEQRGLPFVDVASLPVDPAAARLLPADHARSFRTLPIGFVRGLPVVALADPSDEEAIDGARSVLRAAEFVASPEEAILSQLARLYVRAV
jgi:Type II secretion system (T2SS), protein E, N-terminal domain